MDSWLEYYRRQDIEEPEPPGPKRMPFGGRWHRITGTVTVQRGKYSRTWYLLSPGGRQGNLIVNKGTQLGSRREAQRS